MRQLVVQYKVVDYNTFRNMNDYEVYIFMGMIPYANKEAWEISRFMAYHSVSPYLTKEYSRKSIKELFPLITDEMDKKEEPEITNDDFDKLSQLGDMMAKQLGEGQ